MRVRESCVFMSLSNLSLELPYFVKVHETILYNLSIVLYFSFDAKTAAVECGGRTEGNAYKI